MPDGPAAGLHRFTSYTRARTTDLHITDTGVSWALESPKGQRLEVQATTGGRATGLLPAPVRTQMHQRVAETLDGTISVRLLTRGRTQFEDVGQCAGIEVHGSIDRLLATPGRSSGRPELLTRRRAAEPPA